MYDKTLDWRDVHPQGPYLVVMVSPDICSGRQLSILNRGRPTDQHGLEPVTMVEMPFSFIGCGCMHVIRQSLHFSFFKQLYRERVDRRQNRSFRTITTCQLAVSPLPPFRPQLQPPPNEQLSAPDLSPHYSPYHEIPLLRQPQARRLDIGNLNRRTKGPNDILEETRTGKHTASAETG